MLRHPTNLKPKRQSLKLKNPDPKNMLSHSSNHKLKRRSLKLKYPEQKYAESFLKSQIKKMIS